MIYGPEATQAGGNSYAIWVEDSTSALTIRGNVVYAGTGGPGTNGTGGANGAEGAGGTAGAAAKDTSANCFAECTSAVETAGGAGGSKTCEGASVAGGGDSVFVVW